MHRKNLLLILLGCLVLALPMRAQGPNEISIPEFRQALTDSLEAADAVRSTQYAKMVAGVSDETLARWYQAVPNGRRFQQAAAGLKAYILGPRSPLPPRHGPTPAMSWNPAARRPELDPQPANSSSPLTDGIGSASAPSLLMSVPNYPSGSNWSLMASTLQGLGYLAAGDASTQAGCIPDQEANLSVIVSTFEGIKDAATTICDAVPDPVVIVLGEGTAVPAKEICFVVNLIIGGFNSAFEGFFEDCQTQGQILNGANSKAAYNNTIALYNLEFRLTVEENLGSTLGPVGLFETPAANGGYLESVRAIVADTINNMIIAGMSMTQATASLQSGDVSYNALSYKAAYKAYQTAYGLAVK